VILAHMDATTTVYTWVALSVQAVSGDSILAFFSFVSSNLADNQFTKKGSVYARAMTTAAMKAFHLDEVRRDGLDFVVSMPINKEDENIMPVLIIAMTAVWPKRKYVQHRTSAHANTARAR
jgi:hypothetical protein